MSIIVGCVLLIVFFGIIVVGRPAASQETAAWPSRPWIRGKSYVLVALVVAVLGVTFILNGLPR